MLLNSNVPSFLCTMVYFLTKSCMQSNTRADVDDGINSELMLQSPSFVIVWTYALL